MVAIINESISGSRIESWSYLQFRHVIYIFQIAVVYWKPDNTNAWSHTLGNSTTKNKIISYLLLPISYNSCKNIHVHTYMRFINIASVRGIYTHVSTFVIIFLFANRKHNKRSGLWHLIHPPDFCVYLFLLQFVVLLLLCLGCVFVYIFVFARRPAIFYFLFAAFV